MSTKTNLLIAVAAAVAGFAAVYVTLGPKDNGPKAPEAPSAAKTSPTAPLAAFVYSKSPTELADITFQNDQAQPIKLSDFRGRVIVLNLWATWCAPCREEMPSFDRLQRDLGSDKFEVVALSLDRAGAEASKKFLQEVKAEHLKLYVDPTGKQGFPLKLIGMPTTILIDKQGREIGRLTGPAEWDTPDAKKMIEKALAG